MKHIAIFCFFAILILFLHPIRLSAQKEKKSDMKSKINLLLDDYNLYADFTEDGNKISSRYKEQFKAIFASGAEIVNEMPGTPGFGKMQSPSQYTEELSEWFPKGVSTKLSNRKEIRKGVPETADYDSVYVYSVVKDISARDKNREKVEVTNRLYIVIGYKQSKDELKITHITKSDKEARGYAHLPGWYAGKITTNAPLQLSMGVMPALGSFSAKLPEIDEGYAENLSLLKSPPSFNWSANLQLLAGLGKKIQIGVGIGASQYRQSLQIEALDISFEIQDIYGVDGIRHVTINDFTETYSQTMLQIPLFMRVNLAQSSSIRFFIDLGIAPSLNVGNGSNTYKGIFNAYNTYSGSVNSTNFDYTLREINDPAGNYDEAFNTALGLYENLSADSEVAEEHRVSSSAFNLMALGGMGISAKINDKLSFFGAGKVYYGLLNQQNSETSEDSPNWINALNYRSLLLNSSTLKPFMGGLELGIIYNLRAEK